MKFSKSFILRLLFRLRGISVDSQTSIMESLFIPLWNTPEEVVWGLVAQPWTFKGGVKTLNTSEFKNFNEPGYAKMVWNFSFKEEGGDTLVATETRIQCMDPYSKRMFSIYWFFIKPLSGWIRKEMLRQLKKTCEN